MPFTELLQEKVSIEADRSSQMQESNSAAHTKNVNAKRSKLGKLLRPRRGTAVDGDEDQDEDQYENEYEKGNDVHEQTDFEKPPSCEGVSSGMFLADSANPELGSGNGTINDNSNENDGDGGNDSDASSYDAFALDRDQYFPDGGVTAWVTVFGSCIGLMTVFGIMDTMASVQLYITKHQLADVKLSSVSWIFSLYMFTNLAMGVIAGPIFDIFGARRILIVGMILNCGGLYALAFSSKLWHFILSFGICTGIGSGLMLTPLVGVVSHWFLKRRGMANGFSECGSVSGVFFPIMLRSLYPSIGYKKTMLVLASICVFLCIISLLTVKDRSDELNKDHLHLSNRERLINSYKSMINIKNLKQKSYLFLVLSMFFDEFSIILVITYIATYGSSRNIPESTTYIIVTVMNASGIFGKIIPAYLSDKFGRFNIMMCTMVTLSVSLFAIWLPYYNLAGFYIFAVVYGFAFGAVYALTPVLISQISQTKEFGSRYATAYFVVAFGNLISMPIGSQFINEETVSNYDHMIIFAGATCVFATFLLLMSRTALVGWKVFTYV
jgi:MFS family permease